MSDQDKPEEAGSWSRLHVDLAEARAQLDAERDKVETLVDALKQLREQLAAERERCEEPRCDFVSHLQLREQLDAAVEALKEVKPGVKQLYGKGSVSTIDAALAKVGK